MKLYWFMLYVCILSYVVKKKNKNILKYIWVHLKNIFNQTINHCTLSYLSVYLAIKFINNW